MNHSQYSSLKQQNGNILLISLVLLGAISILGLSSMRGALVEESIATNIQDQHLATESAESALRAGERKLKTSAPNPDRDGGYYTFIRGTIPDIFTWNNSNSYTIPDADWGVDNLQPAPRYKIELFAAPDSSSMLGDGGSSAERLATSSKYIRIIGHGQGRSENSIALEESIVIYE